MNEHKLILLGGPRGELRVPADILLEAVSALLEGARQATRFMMDGESTRKGPRPAWLDAVCRIEVTGLTAGSAALAMEAPTLEEAAPDRFGKSGQGSLFAESQHSIARRTAVELFGDVLSAALEGQKEQVMADRALLDTCVRFARAAGGAFDAVRLDGLSGRTRSITVGRDDIPKIELLRDETPGPQAVRVSGILDTISASKSEVLLILPDGDKIAARVEDHDLATLQRLFGANVVVSGIAHYRPSGRLLIIDAESLSEAREADALFATAPAAVRPFAPLVPQDEHSGVAAFFGKWPGDETEEELLEALRAVG